MCKNKNWNTFKNVSRNGISKVQLNSAGPNWHFLYYILKTLGIEIASIYNATTISHNGCKLCIRARKKDY